MRTDPAARTADTVTARRLPAVLFEQSMSAAANAIFITDRDGLIVWANAAFCSLSGYPLEEVLGRLPSVVKSNVQNREFYRLMWESILNGEVWESEFVERCKNGTLYTVDEVITPLYSADGAITHFVSIQHDITRRKKDMAHHRHMALHDPLTGLANRVQFEQAYRQITGNARDSKTSVAALYIDLDRFKTVNDTFGHRVGDHLLQAVAERLRTHVRDSDIVARLGGDEFAVLLPDLTGTAAVEQLAAKLIAGVCHPYVIDGHKLEVGASIGIAMFPADGADPDELMTKADEAMYRAKRQGGNTFLFHARTPPGES